MPCHFNPPFYRKRPPSTEQSAKPRRRRIAADLAYIGFKSGGFAVSNLMLALGVPLFFFLAIAGWNLDLLFLQLGNLASRYLGADPARQIAFSAELRYGFFGAAALIACLRLPRFLTEVVDTREQQ